MLKLTSLAAFLATLALTASAAAQGQPAPAPPPPATSQPPTGQPPTGQPPSAQPPTGQPPAPATAKTPAPAAQPRQAAPYPPQPGARPPYPPRQGAQPPYPPQPGMQPPQPGAQPPYPPQPGARPPYPPPPGGYPPPGYGYPPRGYGYPPNNGGYPPGYRQAPNYNYGIPQLPPPRVLPYREDQPDPPGYHEDTRIRRGFVIAGAVTFGSTYVISAAVAAGFLDENSGEDMVPLFIPVAGPFVAIGTSDPSPLGTAALILDGLAQSVGVALFIVGLTDKEKIWKRNDLTMRVAPMPLPGGGGGALIGEF